MPFSACTALIRRSLPTVQSIACVSTPYRLLQTLGSLPTTSSSLIVDRPLDYQQHANRVDPSAILREINRVAEARNAIISAEGFRHRLLQAQREELIRVAPSFRSSSSTDVLVSRILQVVSLAAAQVTSLRIGSSLLSSVTPFVMKVAISN
jgi:hypothetical protein